MPGSFLWRPVGATTGSLAAPRGRATVGSLAVERGRYGGLTLPPVVHERYGGLAPPYGHTSEKIEYN